MNNNIQVKADAIAAQLASIPQLKPYVDVTLPVPQPFCGTGQIKLIILGQDPTVVNVASRKKITTVLTLDRPGNLKTYLTGLCASLGLDIDKHVYATNFLKNFFVQPPTTIKAFDVFQHFKPHWLPLLLEELAFFDGVPVVTLGEPVLKLVAQGNASQRVKDYWGYDAAWQEGNSHPFGYMQPADNVLGRKVFPFPHQTSTVQPFYRSHLADYQTFARQYI